jgi:hypothetical protein
MHDLHGCDERSWLVPDDDLRTYIVFDQHDGVFLQTQKQQFKTVENKYTWRQPLSLNGMSFWAEVSM